MGRGLISASENDQCQINDIWVCVWVLNFECRETKAIILQWPNAKNTTNQSELKANTCNQHQA